MLMTEVNDAKFVYEMLDVQAHTAAIIQKTKLRKIYLFVAILMGLSLVLPARHTHGGMVAVNLFIWILVIRLDSDIKLLKLAAKIQEKEILIK